MTESSGSQSNVESPKNDFSLFRSILFNSISMLKTNTLVQFEPIPTLRLEAMRGISLETSNFAT